MQLCEQAGGLLATPPGREHVTGQRGRYRENEAAAAGGGGAAAAALADGRLMLAVDVSNWLRPDAATSPERLFCHVYGRGKGQAQMIPGWPYSVVAALEPGRTSWTAVLDAVRLGPAGDETDVTAVQVRGVSPVLSRPASRRKATRASRSCSMPGTT